MPSIDSIVTRGFGAWGGLSHVVTAGFDLKEVISKRAYKSNKISIANKHNRINITSQKHNNLSVFNG